MSYCCTDCQHAGIDAVVKHKCCEIHHHHHAFGLITHIDPHTCDSHIDGHHGECDIERLHYDLSSSKSLTIDLKPIETQIISLMAMDFKTTGSAFINHDFKHYIELYEKQKPPNLQECIYFDMLNSLLI